MMNILAPLNLTPGSCQGVRCGSCQPCLRRAMTKTAEHCLDLPDREEALLSLLEILGLVQQRETSGRNR